MDIEIDEHGNKRWKLNGELHREDGPAIDYVNGDKYWFLYGDAYIFDKWLELTPLSDQEKVMMRLKYAK